MSTRVTETSRTYRDDPRDHDTIVAAFEGQGWKSVGVVRSESSDELVTGLHHPDMPGQFREVERLAEPEQSIDDALGIKP